MTDKERLEEIEERVLVDKVYYKYLDGEKGHWGKVYTLSEEDYNYLIERVQELEEALEFYADEETYETKFATDTDEICDPFTLIELDEGKKARKALEGEE